MANNRTVVGVDVGGTFTDVFFLNETDGSCNVAKVPSTHRDQSVGIRDGIAQRFDNLSEVSLIIHGTTVGTNALLERKGAKTGIITTSGFRDVIEMRRRDRPETWGLWGMFEPVISRDLRLEVNERVLADGIIHTVVDETEVVNAAIEMYHQDHRGPKLFEMYQYCVIVVRCCTCSVFLFPEVI